MDDERLDFSTLDPSRDELRWARTIDRVAAQALADRRQRLSIEHQLLRWARPVLAVAAAACALAWAGGWRGDDSRSSTAEPPALTVAHWAANNQIPATDDLVTTLRSN
jgi:hypothetical protein